MKKLRFLLVLLLAIMIIPFGVFAEGEEEQSQTEGEQVTTTAAEESDKNLFEAVMALPEKYRIVIHLFYYEGYSVQEIAKILHRREGTVKSQLTRGRKILKEELQEEWRDDE